MRADLSAIISAKSERVAHSCESRLAEPMQAPKGPQLADKAEKWAQKCDTNDAMSLYRGTGNNHKASP